MKNRTITFTTTFVALGFLALASTIQALNPPPDGGYPGQNTAEGDGALDSLTFFHGQPSATDNTALGFHALVNNTVGNENTAVGKNALLGNVNGDSNTATGVSTLVFANGNYNTAIGKGALSIIGSGSFNAALGGEALSSSINGSFNTALGYSAGVGIGSANNVICIGANVAGDNVSNSCYIGSIFDQTAADGVQVFINSNDKLGTTTSSKRFKEAVKPMNQTSEALFALKPVIFRYKKEIDPTGRSQFGLVAEDVEKVSPDLVVRDKEGKPYSVRYDQINAMLLNEFLKEHRKNEVQQSKIEQQAAKIALQQKQIDALAAGLQKVSAQLEVTKHATQVALNRP
jgi:trimeric autotransporter adhesin